MPEAGAKPIPPP